MLLKWIQSIITKGLVIYIITLAVSFQVWNIYVIYNTNHLNLMSATLKASCLKAPHPDSKVFVKEAT